MSTWQMIAEFMFDLSHSTFAYRLVEFFVCALVELAIRKPASVESVTMRWLPSLLRLAGLRPDQAQFLSLIAQTSWTIGRVVTRPGRTPGVRPSAL
jgi:hypothetical protein